MPNKFLDERGFLLLNVIFLTIIVSFAAIIFLNGAGKINNSRSILRLTALNLANEQLAEIEGRAAAGNLPAGNISFLGAAEDLKTYNADEKNLVEFSVETKVKNFSGYENLREVSVKVSWTFGGRNYEIESEKIIRVKFSEE